MKAVAEIGDAAKALWGEPNGRVLIWACALVLAFVPINFAMLQMFEWSAYWPTRSWLFGDEETLDDSWRVMIQAYEWIKANPGGDLYQAIFFEQQTRFQYAPTSLLPLAAMDAFGIAPNPDLFDAINHVMIGVNAAAVAALSWVLLEKLGADARVRMGATLLAGLACLLFYPVMMGYHLGQLQVWINALFACACLAWLLERRALAGVLIGLICLMKPQFALFVVWAPLRREWRFLIALVATGAIGGLISLALFGFDNHLNYLEVLQFLSRHGESYWANQSFNGLTHRLLGHGVGAEWDAHAFPPFDPLVYGVTLATSAGVLAAALWLKRGAGPGAGLFDFQLAALAFTIASPVAWEHHYGVSAAMFAGVFAAVVAMEAGARRRAWLVGLALSYALAANTWVFVRTWTEAPINLAQSYLLFAGLGVVAMLRLGATAGPSKAEA